MSEDTTVRINRNLIALMKHFAISRSTSLKSLLEGLLSDFSRKELEAVKARDPLLYAVITAEQVDPTEEEIREIDEDKQKGKERTYSLDEIRREFKL